MSDQPPPSAVPPPRPAATDGGLFLGEAAPRGRGGLMVEIAPLVVAGLIVALLAALVWLADRREREEAGDALIRDTLWVEQALRFQIEAGEEAIERLAFDMTSTRLGEEVIAARLRTIVGSHPEFAEVEWRDDLGRIRLAVPPDVAPDRDAAARGRPFVRGFAAPRRLGSQTIVDLNVPVFDHDVRVGRLTAHLRLERLLALYVPWWISQNNHVTLTDVAGAELAHKSAMTPVGGARRHSLSFDPPLPGVFLVLTAHAGSTNFLRNLLGAGVVGLAVVAVVALFGLMLHHRRRLAAERDLGAAQALRRAMENSLTVGMRARDLEERIIYVNPAFCRMVGFEAEELIGRGPPLPYWLPELVEEPPARHQALGEAALEPLSFETRFRRRTGEIFDVRVYEAPLIDADGIHRGWMGSLVDVTEVKRAEERERLHAESLTRTGRLISLGEMASTISHELNQPLAAIASYAAGCLHLSKAGRPSGELVDALEKLEAQARRAGRVIRRVHDFVRKRDPESVPLDLGELIASIAAFVVPDAKNQRVDVATELPDAPLVVHGDRTLLEQVLLNLVRNGMEAMAGVDPALRRLEIAVRRRTGSEGDVAVLSVADRGAGIAPEVAEKLFTPFFSTKPEGMGMGLAICRSIVELHRGRLEFASREGGGTVFSVTLPVEEVACP
ncbi:MAG: PAS domain S-box protein [Phyllobacteriaceae bacterium]|nr:PAS domain S-box protein [Phyllobacteriaceae bacterium]